MLPLAKILVLEERSKLCESLATLLSRESFEVYSTNKGEDALRWLEDQRFDIALLDLMKSDVQVHQLVRRINLEKPNTFILLMVENDSLELSVVPSVKGVFDYLRKPFLFDELLIKIKNALHQKKLADELHENKRMLSLSKWRHKFIVKNSPDIIYSLDSNSNFTFISRSAEKMLGVRKKEIIGKHYTQIIHTRDLDKAKWAFNERRTGDRSTVGLELRLMPWDQLDSIDNEQYGLCIELKSTGLYDKPTDSREKKFLGTYGVARNITDRIEAEKANEKLERRLQQATKMEAIGTLAGGVAHDLNNILSGIVSYPELLLMQIPEDSPFRKPILTMQETGKRAAAMVQDLLTLSRRGVTITEVMNVNLIIEQYLKSPEYDRLKSFHPNLLVETELKADLQNICGSPLHISKTVMNLVSNAAEAMPEGGKLIIRTENRYVKEAIKGYEEISEGEYVVVQVVDSGVGISQEDQEKIFEPFYTKKVMGRSGTGLGMTVVWGTVKDHEGFVDVVSAPGRGTIFSLYFPSTSKKIVKKKKDLSIKDVQGNGETILVIDDVVEQREITSEMLEELGYRVWSVSSGEEAIEFLNNQPADLLVLDMIMDPGINGLETYRKILQHNPEQKAIIASGYSKNNLVKEAQRLGVGEYIKKPYTMDKIGLAIKSALTSTNNYLEQLPISRVVNK